MLTRILHVLFTQRQKECFLCRPFEYVPAVTLEKSFEIAEMSLLTGAFTVSDVADLASERNVRYSIEGTHQLSQMAWLRRYSGWIFLRHQH